MKRTIVATLLAIVTSVACSAPLFAEAQPSASERKELFREGAKLWPLYCNTCHSARPGAEKAGYEWDQIMMHMQTLGNIPPRDEQAILEYLKASH
jgi:mono/diheme cytochrome c family protein